MYLQTLVKEKLLPKKKKLKKKPIKIKYYSLKKKKKIKIHTSQSHISLSLSRNEWPLSSVSQNSLYSRAITASKTIPIQLLFVPFLLQQYFLHLCFHSSKGSTSTRFRSKSHLGFLGFSQSLFSLPSSLWFTCVLGLVLNLFFLSQGINFCGFVLNYLYYVSVCYISRFFVSLLYYLLLNVCVFILMIFFVCLFSS